MLGNLQIRFCSTTLNVESEVSDNSAEEKRDGKVLFDACKCEGWVTLGIC